MFSIHNQIIDHFQACKKINYSIPVPNKKMKQVQLYFYKTSSYFPLNKTD